MCQGPYFPAVINIFSKSLRWAFLSDKVHSLTDSNWSSDFQFVTRNLKGAGLFGIYCWCFRDDFVGGVVNPPEKLRVLSRLSAKLKFQLNFQSEMLQMFLFSFVNLRAKLHKLFSCSASPTDPTDTTTNKNRQLSWEVDYGEVLKSFHSSVTEISLWIPILSDGPRLVFSESALQRWRQKRFKIFCFLSPISEPSFTNSLR